VRQTHPELDKVVVTKIKSGEIPRAVDVREKLTKIAKAGGKALNSFIESEGSFERSYERALDHGADNTWYQRFHKFRSQLADDDARDDLTEMNEAHRKKCIFELKKIQQAIKLLLDRLA
jgi:hypothetical protein